MTVAVLLEIIACEHSLGCSPFFFSNVTVADQSALRNLGSIDDVRIGSVYYLFLNKEILTQFAS